MEIHNLALCVTTLRELISWNGYLRGHI